MKYKLNILVALLVITCSFASAQKCAMKSANNAFSKFNFQRAIDIYTRVVTKDPSNTAAIEKLADAYRLVNNTIEAEKWYGVLAAQPNAKTSNIFQYSQFLKANGKYDDAAKYYNTYAGIMPSDMRGADNKAIGSTSKSLLEPNKAYTVSPININTKYWDYSPVYFKDGIVFVSNRGLDGSVKRKDLWTDSRFHDLYFAKKTSNTTFENPVRLKGSQPNRKYHDGSATFTSDFKESYFTRNNYMTSKATKSTDNIIKLIIMKAVYNESDNKWVELSPLMFNNKEYSVAHPSLSKDGQRLYFISDMPGGEGETDIYMSTKQGITWGAPINLGKNINTPGKEMFPYIHEDGTLFFSSDGRIGLGGLEIYMATPKGTSFDAPVNIGSPVNSNKDDFGYVMATDGKSGYFTSNRDGGSGEDDIYSFERQPMQCIEGFVYNAKTNERIEGAKVEIINIPDMTTPINGDFNACPIKGGMKYMVTASKAGFRKNTLEVTAPMMGNAMVEIPLKKIENIDLVVTVNEKDKGKMKGATITLIDKKTGRRFPCTTGVEGTCTFGLQPNANYDIEVTAPTPKEGCAYGTETRAVTTIGKTAPSTIYEDFTLVSLCEGDIIEIPDIYYDLDKYYIRPDAAKQLDTYVLPAMNKYPNMIIELGSHTDCRATMAYNAKLSQNRASAAVQYLVSKGISPSRMTAKGYGESMLKLPCPCEGSIKSNCTEEQHQQNRRTEFKIVRLR